MNRVLVRRQTAGECQAPARTCASAMTSVGTGMLALHHILETVVQLFKDQLLQLVGRLRAP